jgi:NRPS condensation-like uncharacterized protein
MSEINMPKKNLLSMQIDPSAFEPATEEEKRQADVMSESTSFFKDGMRKLMKNPLAVGSIIALVLIVLLILIAPKIVPYGYEEIIKVGYANPLLAMSNIGILEVDKLALDGHEPTDGFMSGAVKYKPYALLSATSMRKELTLSMCVRGNDEDKRIVEHFFDLIEEAIKLLTVSADE